MNFFSTLFLVSAINGLFLVAILILVSLKSNKVSENIFLALFLAIISAYQLKEYLILQGHFATYPHLMAVFVPLLYLLGPLYFFYIKYAVDSHSKLAIKDTLHLTPALICFFTILPFYLLSAQEKLAMYDAPQAGDCELNPNRVFYYGFMFLSALYYCLKSLDLLRQRKKNVDGRKNNPGKTKLIWLEFYTKGFLFFLFIFLMAQLIFIFTDFYQYYVMLSTIAAFSILIHVINYWSIKDSIILPKKVITTGPKLSEEKTRATKAHITALLEEEQLYLNSDLNAKDLCERLSINSLYLSQLINQEFNCNFTFLINSYRIDRAKEMIKNQQFKHLNLLGIAMEVGFNTKNTFIRAFKRHTGQTPSEFKRS